MLRESCFLYINYSTQCVCIFGSTFLICFALRANSKEVRGAQIVKTSLCVAQIVKTSLCVVQLVKTSLCVAQIVKSSLCVARIVKKSSCVDQKENKSYCVAQIVKKSSLPQNSTKLFGSLHDM